MKKIVLLTGLVLAAGMATMAQTQPKKPVKRDTAAAAHRPMKAMPPKGERKAGDTTRAHRPMQAKGPRHTGDSTAARPHKKH
jgi:hypothetical protein